MPTVSRTLCRHLILFLQIGPLKTVIKTVQMSSRIQPIMFPDSTTNQSQTGHRVSGHLMAAGASNGRFPVFPIQTTDLGVIIRVNRDSQIIKMPTKIIKIPTKIIKILIRIIRIPTKGRMSLGPPSVTLVVLEIGVGKDHHSRIGDVADQLKGMGMRDLVPSNVLGSQRNP